jgi:predicted RNA-binding Zn-ribbon protein involved in translation (DUF1610 family)
MICNEGKTQEQRPVTLDQERDGSLLFKTDGAQLHFKGVHENGQAVYDVSFQSTAGGAYKRLQPEVPADKTELEKCLEVTGQCLSEFVDRAIVQRAKSGCRRLKIDFSKLQSKSKASSGRKVDAVAVAKLMRALVRIAANSDRSCAKVKQSCVFDLGANSGSCAKGHYMCREACVDSKTGDVQIRSLKLDRKKRQVVEVANGVNQSTVGAYSDVKVVCWVVRPCRDRPRGLFMKLGVKEMNVWNDTVIQAPMLLPAVQVSADNNLRSELDPKEPGRSFLEHKGEPKWRMQMDLSRGLGDLDMMDEEDHTALLRAEALGQPFNKGDEVNAANWGQWTEMLQSRLDGWETVRSAQHSALPTIEQLYKGLSSVGEVHAAMTSTAKPKTPEQFHNLQHLGQVASADSARAGQQPIVVTKDGVQRVIPPEEVKASDMYPCSKCGTCMVIRAKQPGVTRQLKCVNCGFVVQSGGVQAAQKMVQPTSVSVDTAAQAKEALANSLWKDTKSNSTDTKHVTWSSEAAPVGDLQQAVQSMQGQMQQMQAMIQHLVSAVAVSTSA